MVKIEFLGPIGRDSLEIDIKNLKELKDFFKEDEDIQKWLKISAVAVNDSLVSSLEMELKDGDKISILPPVCGG